MLHPVLCICKSDFVKKHLKFDEFFVGSVSITKQKMEGTEAETEPVNWEICNESYKFQNMVGGHNQLIITYILYSTSSFAIACVYIYWNEYIVGNYVKLCWRVASYL